jgi:RNA polymerase sigma-70 factor, ECF subfamily
MPAPDTPGRKPVSGSPEDSSTAGGDPLDAQLSGSDGVSTGVSSVAIDRSLLNFAGTKASAPTASSVEPGSDAEVMLRVKAGDDSAYAFLIQKYRRPLVGFMYRMCHNPATAEELAQEVFLRVYRSRSSYEPSAKFSTWLYRIATNLAVNHARDTKAERSGTSLDEPDPHTGLTIDVADPETTAEQKLLRRERLAAIRREVEALPERQRLAVIMHKYQNMDYRQIADVLKLSESATKSLLFRAYETLRVKLEKFL